MKTEARRLAYGDDAKRHERAASRLPAIEINQRWICYGKHGRIFRRIRVLAFHPDGGLITCDDPHPEQTHRPSYCGSMTRCPEYNLRFVFELEKSET